MHNLLFCAHTLRKNYVTETFLLVRSPVSSKQQLCFVHGQSQKTEQKHATKNFVEFHNHSPLLTMGWPSDGNRNKGATKVSIDRLLLCYSGGGEGGGGLSSKGRV